MYDEAGRIVSRTAPDKGTVETVYDAKDRIRFTRDARQKESGYFTALVYDDRDRVVRTGEVRGCGGNADCGWNMPDAEIPAADLHLLFETIYGVPDKNALLAKDAGADAFLLDNILGRMQGVLPGDVGAVISYDGNGIVNAIKLASYDRLGRKENQWLIYRMEAGAPAIEISYAYNVSNELERSTVSEWDANGLLWL